MRDAISDFCVKLGSDSLLVQGAGGNVSWKDDDTLWMKASGVWLADAKDKDIFVPVDLCALRRSIKARIFSVTPNLNEESSLRPSIETMLHALMPQTVVVHLHAIDILAYLVRDNPAVILEEMLGKSDKWCLLNYYKPGAQLAEAICDKLIHYPNVNIVFLQNHGVVIGGSCVSDVNDCLQNLLTILAQSVNSDIPNGDEHNKKLLLHLDGYHLCTDPFLNRIATNKFLSSRLYEEWVLYPDHAVFLGAKPAILGKTITLDDIDCDEKPAFIFDFGGGVYESNFATTAHKAQLRCYYDVLVRQSPYEKLVALSDAAVHDLLVWDAEKYRKSNAK